MHSCRVDIHMEGLQDDCPECEDHASNPTSRLDHKMLANLITRNYEYRFGDKTIQPRSYNEAIAMTNITNIMEKMGKLFESQPLLMMGYLRKNWRVNI